MENSIFKGIIRFSKALLLWIVTRVLKFSVGIVGSIWSLLIVAKRGELAKYINKIAIDWDKFMNSVCGPALNKALKKDEKGGYMFGSIKDTVSYAIAINKIYDRLNRFGNWIAKTLDKIDNNHLEKSIKHHD